MADSPESTISSSEIAAWTLFCISFIVIFVLLWKFVAISRKPSKKTITFEKDEIYEASSGDKDLAMQGHLNKETNSLLDPPTDSTQLKEILVNRNNESYNDGSSNDVTGQSIPKDDVQINQTDSEVTRDLTHSTNGHVAVGLQTLVFSPTEPESQSLLSPSGVHYIPRV